jgi:hypothetical protein
MVTKAKAEGISLTMYVGADALTVEGAKALIGWTEEPDGGEWEKFDIRSPENGKKVRLTKNPTNRPFRMGLAKRYASEMLRRAWRLNGETIVVDVKGMVQSGQHRLIGLILAESMRKNDPETWNQYGKGALKIECLVVEGISAAKEVADTLDIGQKRSLGDVLFRRGDFEGTEKQNKRLANVMAGAIRLAWIRVGGKMVSDAPHFPHSEALATVEAHPKLVEAVQFVVTEDGGEGSEGKKISAKVSLAYAGALLYLMATAKSNSAKGTINTSLWEKACEFWTLFGSGAGLKAGHPILTLRNQLDKVGASGGKERDIVVGMIVKAWNAFIDGKDLDAKGIKIKEAVTDGKRVLAEEPRIGGLDIHREPEEEEEGADTLGDWTVGDSAWVRDEDGAHWKGKIRRFEDGEAVLYFAKEKTEYQVSVDALCDEKPEDEAEEEEAEEEEAPKAKKPKAKKEAEEAPEASEEPEAEEEEEEEAA